MQEVCTGQEGDRTGQPDMHERGRRTIPYADSVDMDWGDAWMLFWQS